MFGMSPFDMMMYTAPMTWGMPSWSFGGGSFGIPPMMSMPYMYGCGNVAGNFLGASLMGTTGTFLGAGVGSTLGGYLGSAFGPAGWGIGSLIGAIGGGAVGWNMGSHAGWNMGGGWGCGSPFFGCGW